MVDMDIDAFRRAQGIAVKQPAIKPGVSRAAKLVSDAKPQKRSSVKPTKPRTIKEPTSLELRLPFAPSMNNYWRHTSRGTYISAAGKKFSANVQAAVWQQIGKPKPMTGRLAIDIVLFGRDKRSYDVDNYAKSTIDAMAKAGVFENDSQVDMITIRRGEVSKPGSMLITIQERNEA